MCELERILRECNGFFCIFSLHYSTFCNTLERVDDHDNLGFQFHTIFVGKSIAIRSLKMQIKLLTATPHFISMFYRSEK